MLHEIVIKFVASPAQLAAASEANLHSARTWAHELGCEVDPNGARVDALGDERFEAIVVCADCKVAPLVVVNKHDTIVRCVRDASPPKLEWNITSEKNPPAPDAPIASVDVFANAPATPKPAPKPHARVKLPS